MEIFPHVYWSLCPTDLHVPSRVNDYVHGYGVTTIPATKNYSIFHGKDRSFYFESQFKESEKKLRTQESLIKSIYKFGDCLNDLTDDLSKNPHCRQTYKVRLSRIVWFYIPHDLYNYRTYDASRILITQPNRDDHCEFIYSKVADYIYTSNIREILGYNFKRINLRDEFGKLHYDQESNIDPKVPLYVYNCDDTDVTVKTIQEDQIVVHGEHLYQIGTENSTPQQILSLLKRRCEPLIKGKEH